MVKAKKKSADGLYVVSLKVLLCGTYVRACRPIVRIERLYILFSKNGDVIYHVHVCFGSKHVSVLLR
jgi:hypothetical protein